MLQGFQDHNAKHKLFSSADKILVAVSGGIDSVVMLHLFSKLGVALGVIHCNFGLRAQESDADEKFVAALAKKHNALFFSKQFDTPAYAKEKNISIQMAARELRYNWFEEIRKKNKFNCIAFAHNADDVAETILINIARGTGISGLHGIPVKRDKIIRPLLFAQRKEIEAFAKENKIQFREDSSNASDKYTRNKIRHHVIPVLKEVNPLLNASISRMVDHVTEAEQIIDYEIKKTAKRIVKRTKAKTEISIADLKKLSPLNFFLHELLKEFEFDAAVISNISKNISRLKSGKQFFSRKFRLLIDRSKMVITAIQTDEHAIVHVINNNVAQINTPFTIKFRTKEADKFSIIKDPAVACLDFAKLKFPLQLRKWNSGDKFKPLGMTGFKKLSDFFSDSKMSLHDKEEQWLLLSDGDIVWVVGKRIDDRYRVTSKTGRVFVCELK